MKKASFFFLLTVMFFSCSMEDEDLSPNDSQMEQRVSSSARSRTLVSDHPVVVDGIYAFRDVDHYLQYYKDLENLMQTDYADFAYEVSEDIGVSGTRDTSVITVLQRLSNDEFTDPANRYMPFLADPVIQSFANSNFEYRVGDKLFTHVNNSKFFISDINDRTLTETIRRFPKGRKVLIPDIPDGVVMGSSDDTTTIVTRSCSCNVKIERTDCDEIRMSGFCTPGEGGPSSIGSSITLSISLLGYGNSDIASRTFIVAGNFDIPFDISTLPNFSSTSGAVTLYFQVDAGAECGATDLDRIALKPLDGICDDQDRETSWDWKEDGGSQAISYRTKTYRGFFACYQQAKIYSYHNNGGVWNNNKSKLEAHISALRRNAVCDTSSGEQELKDCDHCKSVQASVNTDSYGYFCDGDVTGTFKKELNWQGNTWTIEATQDIDFECCR